MSKIENAKIGSTFLGVEDHGILTAYLHIEGDGWGCGFGGYCLDGPGREINRYLGKNYCGAFIRTVLETLEVDSWEKLKGTIVRVDTEGLGGGIIQIGHIYKDKWFNPKEMFKSLEGAPS